MDNSSAQQSANPKPAAPNQQTQQNPVPSAPAEQPTSSAVSNPSILSSPSDPSIPPPLAPSQPVSQQTPVPSIQSDIPTPEHAISGPTKEAGPTTVKVEAPVQEVMKPSESAPEIAPELKEIGVEDTSASEQPKVPQQHVQDVTIELAKESTPVPSSPSGMVQLPMDEQYATQVAKTHPVIDSVRWLAMLIVEQVKKAHSSVTKK